MNGDFYRLPTLQEIREAHSWKGEYETYLPLSRYIFRPFGFRLTWVAIRLGLTTEAVSWLSGIVGITGCLFLMSGWEHALPVGLGFLLFFNLLDCVDGSIARATKSENPYGKFLDSICGGIVDLTFWAVVGVTAFRHPQLLYWPSPFSYGPSFWLVVGTLTCLLFIVVGFLERTFDELLRRDWDRSQGVQDVRPKSWGNLLRTINTNLRVRESHYFFLLFTYWTKTIDVLLIMYLLYYLSFNSILLVVYSRRGRRIRNLYY